MKIHLTDHAREMFEERIGCKPHKYLKVATKAWNSKTFFKQCEIANPKYYSNLYKKDTYHHRKHMGLIYVFVEKEDDEYLLITLYPPGSQAGKETRPKSKRLV